MSSLTAEVMACRETRARFAPYALTLLRLVVGYGFLVHVLAKWTRGPAVFAGILQATGVPLPQLMAWLTIATEFAVGIAFLVGAFCRLVSIPAIVLLLVSIFTVYLLCAFLLLNLVTMY